MSDGPANTVDPDLARAIASLAVPGLLVAHRLIQPGDEDALLPEEVASDAALISRRQRASGAARIVARSLLAQLGYNHAAILKHASGAPIWPEGIVGSLAHDDRIAVAAVARTGPLSAVGVDVEPAEALPVDMLSLVATPQEMQSIADDPLHGRVLFAVKEAVYKAVFPLDQRFLEFQDINVDVPRERATISGGRLVAVRHCLSSHIVALAFV
jgi:4'-phosphopantetheinyl transferase EntD